MNGRNFKHLVFILMLVVALSAPAAIPVTATATFVVTKTADTNDGYCDADCSLREAIRASNATPGSDTITLPAGYYLLAIPGAGEDEAATGDLDIYTDLTLNGAGAESTIIDGNRLDQVFEVMGSSEVILAGITISNGLRGINNQFGSTVMVSESKLENNSSPANGGGIANSGSLAIVQSIVRDNQAAIDGGGLWNDGIATVTGVEFTRNFSTGYGYNGGGVYNSGTAILSDVTFNYNTAEFGGGMVNIGNATLNSATFYSNRSGTAGGWGGGGGMVSYEPDSLTSLTNVTFHGNISGSSGGGFDIYEGTAALINVTISENFGGLGGGINAEEASSVSLKNTIISGNTTAYMGPECAGTFNSLGYNLVKDPKDCTLTGDETGNLYGVDAMLGPLADNGGPTLTQALHPLSPALDSVANNQCPPTDQRGITRPLDGNGDGEATCDMGAYERQYIPGFPLEVTLTGPSEGVVGQPQVFAAAVEPITTTLPLTYLWQADGQSPITHTGGLTDTVNYTWEMPEGYYITVTASNEAWSVMDTRYIYIPDVPISGLEASNDSPTLIWHATSFEARVDTGTNVSYYWDFGDDSYGIGASTSHIYATTGVYTATVYASNSVNGQVDTTSVTVVPPSHWWYFPLLAHLAILP